MKKLFSRFKKGVSIVEVVIAIAVISIISVAAVTTLTYSIKAQNKNLRDFDVATTCDTVIDCYRLSDDYGALLTEIYGSEYNSTEKTINRGSYTLYVEDNGNAITITAKSDNTELFKVEYEKNN